MPKQGLTPHFTVPNVHDGCQSPGPRGSITRTALRMGGMKNAGMLASVGVGQRRRYGLSVAAAAMLSIMVAPVVADTPPNIVLVVVDDAAWMDFGSYGGEADTPTIDALAERGVMFTQHHTTPFCAPSRAALLTGIDHHLAGVGTIREVLPSEHRDKPGYTMAIPPDVPTVAELLRERGYRTYMSGKWHLGQGSGELPVDRGFERAFALDASGADHWRQRSYLPYYRSAPWFDGREPAKLPEDFYSSRFIIDQMLQYLSADRARAEPFFAYVGFLALHIPVAAPKAFSEPYYEVYADGWEQLRLRRWQRAKALGLIPDDAELGGWPNTLRRWESLAEQERLIAQASMAVNAGMLTAMDAELGRLVAYLEQTGQLANTVFVVTADNGPAGGDPWNTVTRPWLQWQGYNNDLETLGERDSYVAIGPEWAQGAAGPLNLFKFHSGEGGVRVPLIMAGAGLPEAKRVDGFSAVADIGPTLLALVDGHDARSSSRSVTPDDIDDPLGLRGRSLMPLLGSDPTPIRLARDSWATETSGQVAVYRESFKLVRALPPHGDSQWRLFNRIDDPGETQDLSQALPEVKAELMQRYEAYAKAAAVLPLPEGYEVYQAITANMLRRQWEFYGHQIMAAAALVVGLGVFMVGRRRALSALSGARRAG